MNASDELRVPLVKAHVDSGVCRFGCYISAYLIDGKVRFEIDSECPNVKKFNDALGDVEPFSALKMPYCENKVFEIAGEILSHATCPLPIAVIKCVEVASGLALARNVLIEFSL
ncbi:MAG: hypothetical protein GKC03_07355 [Methanomassiliicoccales archaeon]|nr:hypothetical protein [Methanomassiliicoccales archaeon]NYT14971.1 hypothetical protein [Methanomassiliicoccales archaeon]